MVPDIAAAAVTAATRPAGSRSRAYVTFLAGDGDHVKGVIGLAKGLRKAKSRNPLVVAALPDVPVHPPEHRRTEFAMAYYVINYSKLRLWEFVEYGKMIYLDGDVQVFDNIDHLFDLPNGNFYAVMDCFCEKTWSHTPQNRVGYCQQDPDKVRWPEHLGPKPPLYFNAGMFVFEPDLDTYRDLLHTVKITPPTPFAEQDFLNMYFREVYKPIPPAYNLVVAMLWRHPENFELDEVKVARYCAAGSKPWRFTGEEANMDRDDVRALVKKWWDIFEDESPDHNFFAGRDRDLPVELRSFLAALSEAELRGCFSAPSAA